MPRQTVAQCGIGLDKLLTINVLNIKSISVMAFQFQGVKIKTRFLKCQEKFSLFPPARFASGHSQLSLNETFVVGAARVSSLKLFLVVKISCVIEIFGVRRTFFYTRTAFYADAVYG